LPAPISILMRRTLVLLLAVAAVVTSGCSGPDARRAQELLAQSNAAFAQVDSFRFSARIWTSGAPQDFTMMMRGGGYLRGKRAGDFYLTGSVEGMAELGEFAVLARGGTAYTKTNGTWVQTPLPATPDGRPEALAGFDLAPYITDVQVDEGPLVDGEPTTKITGVIDTTALLEGAFSQLGEVSGGGLDVSQVFDDTRAVLFISDVSQLPVRGLVDFGIELLGERIEMHMDFALTGFGEPVDFPRL
jgi:hypothetical protein